ncbi:MAG: hypothetical protein D6708_13030 [Candidatus Dadabacteria bacterium]|nr:MAG: hypothetical protein D6708_13030 [Candidatus Dadabacteria bacterium]
MGGPDGGGRGFDPEEAVRWAQRLRRERFGLSVATLAVVLLATFLITRLGLGTISPGRWVVLLLAAAGGVAGFYALFATGANLRFPEPSLTREQIFFWTVWGLLPLAWLPRARPIILLFFLAPFSFGMLALNLRQYLGLVAAVCAAYGGLLAYEYARAPAAFDARYQLFLFAIFSLLLTWFAVFGGFVSGLRERLRAQRDRLVEAHGALAAEVEERRRVQAENERLIGELRKALAEIKTLRGLLPICASCKKIRDDEGAWRPLEAYLSEHTHAEFTHGICPECRRRLYPDLKRCTD